ncbi:MAG: hypothetical protein AAF764_12165 [Pseudomonadota bacterium]
MHALKQDHFSDFAAAEAFLAADPAFVACDVMDVWAEDGTLIVISAETLPASAVDRLRADCWAGEIEAYRALDMLG